jgi:1-pyrroline-5-carboxylate dehydrogenase
VPRSLWEGGFQQTLVEQVNKITIGPCTSWDHFTGPVIASGKCEWGERDQGDRARCKMLILPGDDSKGFFVQPTVIVTKDPKSVSMTQEIFGPVMTVSQHSLRTDPTSCLPLAFAHVRFGPVLTV